MEFFFYELNYLRLAAVKNTMLWTTFTRAEFCRKNSTFAVWIFQQQ